MVETTEDGNKPPKRGLQNRHVQLIAIGGTIGTGLFMGAGNSIHYAGPIILLVYLIVGLFMFVMMYVSMVKKRHKQCHLLIFKWLF